MRAVRRRRGRVGGGSAPALEGVRRCPGCGAGVEKNGGCDHMTCRTAGGGGCGHEFCWRCLAPYQGPEGIRAVGNKAHKPACQYHC